MIIKFYYILGCRASKEIFLLEAKNLRSFDKLVCLKNQKESESFYSEVNVLSRTWGDDPSEGVRRIKSREDQDQTQTTNLEGFWREFNPSSDYGLKYTVTLAWLYLALLWRFCRYILELKLLWFHVWPRPFKFARTNSATITSACHGTFTCSKLYVQFTSRRESLPQKAQTLPEVHPDVKKLISVAKYFV